MLFRSVLILAIVIVILDTHFRIPGAGNRNELPFLRGTFEAYNQSSSALLMRTSLIPGFFAALGPFIPDALRALFPGGGTPPPTV